MVLCPDQPARARAYISGVALIMVLISAILALNSGCNPGSQPAYLRSGLEKLRQGKVKVATVYLEKAVEHDPTSFSAQMHLGIALILLDSPRRAIPRFRNAAQLQADDTRALEYLAHAHLMLAEWEAAERVLVAAESIQPTARILTARSVAALRQDRTDDAESLMVRALELDANYATAQYNLALLHQHWRNDTAAAKAFAATHLETGSADRVDQLERALESFSTETPQPPDEAPPGLATRDDTPLDVAPPVDREADPIDRSATDVPARVLEALDRRDYDVALVTLKGVLADAPNHAEAGWQLARLYQVHLGQPEKAARAYLIFSDRHPSDRRAARAIELAWELQKEAAPTPPPAVHDAPAPTLSALEKSKQAFQDGFRAYRRKEWAAATASYRNAVSLNPNFAEGYYHLGLAHRRLGESDHARQALQDAVRLKPDMVEAHYMLAAVYRESQRNDLARDHLVRLLDTDPKYADAHFLIGLVYRDLQKHGQTRQHFDQYLRISPEGRHAAGIRRWLKLNPP